MTPAQMNVYTYEFNESILAQMFAFISVFIEQLKYVKKGNERKGYEGEEKICFLNVEN